MVIPEVPETYRERLTCVASWQGLERETASIIPVRSHPTCNLQETTIFHPLSPHLAKPETVLVKSTCAYTPLVNLLEPTQQQCLGHPRLRLLGSQPWPASCGRFIQQQTSCGGLGNFWWQAVDPSSHLRPSWAALRDLQAQIKWCDWQHHLGAFCRVATGSSLAQKLNLH